MDNEASNPIYASFPIHPLHQQVQPTQKSTIYKPVNDSKYNLRNKAKHAILGSANPHTPNSMANILPTHNTPIQKPIGD